MWLVDPKTGEKSVSLTFLLVSFVAVFGAGVLQLLGKISSVSLFPETFYSCAALYFGRRLSINGKSFGPDNGQKTEEEGK